MGQHGEKCFVDNEVYSTIHNDIGHTHYAVTAGVIVQLAY